MSPANLTHPQLPQNLFPPDRLTMSGHLYEGSDFTL